MAESRSGALAGSGAQGLSFALLKVLAHAYAHQYKRHYFVASPFFWETHFTAMQAATKLCSYNSPAASHYDSNPKI